MSHRTPFEFLSGEPKKDRSQVALHSRANNVADEPVSADLADSNDESGVTSTSTSMEYSSENTDNGSLEYVSP